MGGEIGGGWRVSGEEISHHHMWFTLLSTLLNNDQTQHCKHCGETETEKRQTQRGARDSHTFHLQVLTTVALCTFRATEILDFVTSLKVTQGVSISPDS